MTGDGATPSDAGERTRSIDAPESRWNRRPDGADGTNWQPDGTTGLSDEAGGTDRRPDGVTGLSDGAGGTGQHPDGTDRRPTGIVDLVDRHADHYWFYGSGKVALRDVVAAMMPRSASAASPSGDADESARGDRSPNRGWNVLLPAYVPDAVAEPLHELGVEPRYYAITPDLEPAATDLDRRADEGTVAVLSVDYFGFPAPGRETIATIAREYECYHVDDNAHATPSVSDGRLLGTDGDAGITSLWKTLPVPNGAICYVTDERLRDRFEPSELAGVHDSLTLADARYVLVRRLRRSLRRRPSLVRSIESLHERFSGSAVPEPRLRYEAAKRPCSKLTALVSARTDPRAVRVGRRRNYRAWLDALSTKAGLRPLFPALPDGVCPQCLPVEADRPAHVRSRLDAAGLDVHTWPRLPADVAASPTYATAQYLAAHVLALPVDRRLTPERITTIGASL